MIDGPQHATLARAVMLSGLSQVVFGAPGVFYGYVLQDRGLDYDARAAGNSDIQGAWRRVQLGYMRWRAAGVERRRPGCTRSGRVKEQRLCACQALEESHPVKSTNFKIR